MSYPQGFLFQPSVSLALHSCPSFGSGVLLGPRTDELGRSSSGSAFAPYSGSATSPGFNTHLPYGGEPRAAATLNSFAGPGYDPSSGVSASLDFHPFGALGPYAYGDPAYRKNATRDATATLKAWLNEHRKNPYPTKGEKIMLAIITKMTLTQVSTWFANARRRLKKENKMTWTPRNRSEDEEDDDNGELERHDDDDETVRSNDDDESKSHAPRSRSPSVVLMLDGSSGADPDRGFSDPDFKDSVDRRLPRLIGPAPSKAPPERPSSKDHVDSCSAVQNPTPKPKLWSLAEMATSVDKHKGCTDPSLSGGGVHATPAPQTTFTHNHLYYSAPFLPGYSYGALGPLHSSALHSNGLQQTMLQRADTRDRRPHGHELNTGTSSA